MKKSLETFQGILNIIIVLAIVSGVINYISSINVQKNSNNKDYNESFFKRAKSLDVAKIIEFEVHYYYNNQMLIKRVTDKEDITKLLEYIRSLDIYSQNGTDWKLEEEAVIYSIWLLEEEYYPQGAMNFTSDALFYKGRRYQIPSNVIEDIRKILDSVKIDEINNASIEKGK